MRLKNILEGDVVKFKSKQDKKQEEHREKVTTLKDFLKKQRKEFDVSKRRRSIKSVN